MVAMKEKKFNQGMVFGVFDGLHRGHRFFLRQAMSLCKKLVVVVASDSIVATFKKHPPKHTLSERLTALEKFDVHLEITPGDEQSGSWQVLKKYQPDIILLGYDQKSLKRELQRLGLPYTTLAPYRPDRYKTSLLTEVF